MRRRALVGTFSYRCQFNPGLMKEIIKVNP